MTVFKTFKTAEERREILSETDELMLEAAVETTDVASMRLVREVFEVGDGLEQLMKIAGSKAIPYIPATPTLLAASMSILVRAFAASLAHDNRIDAKGAEDMVVDLTSFLEAAFAETYDAQAELHRKKCKGEKKAKAEHQNCPTTNVVQ